MDPPRTGSSGGKQTGMKQLFHGTFFLKWQEVAVNLQWQECVLSDLITSRWLQVCQFTPRARIHVSHVTICYLITLPRPTCQLTSMWLGAKIHVWWKKKNIISYVTFSESKRRPKSRRIFFIGVSQIYKTFVSYVFQNTAAVVLKLSVCTDVFLATFSGVNYRCT